MSRIHRNCIDASFILKQNDIDDLTCSICLQFMVEPYALNCSANSKHIFGINCIKEWVKVNKARECPLCRSHFSNLTIQYQLKQLASKFHAQCKDCQLIVPSNQLSHHLKQCEAYLKRKYQMLRQVVENQQKQLQKQINPHLRQSHSQIYKQYVRDWDWLNHDLRDWKWWWWCNNPWWHNKSCAVCINLWHKYQQQIDLLESTRIQFIQQIGGEEAYNLNKA